jgi:hydrogenase-1 operon protein HyaE
MSLDLADRPDTAASVQPPRPAALSRLAAQTDACWVDAQTVADWAAAGGDRVLLLAGDALRFPEGQDVAAVLPELRRAAPRGFAIGVVPAEHEDALARRYGVLHWPSLVFLRDGGYVATVSGMHDWLPFIDRVTQALALPVTRAPGIGIPLLVTGGGAPACH